MNKYAYLEELEKRIGRLSQYQRDNIVNDYSVAIGRMLDDYMEWDQIQKEIGTPKEAAERVLNGRPMYIASDYRQRNGYGQTAGGGYAAAPRPEKRGMSAFWKAYLILGIVTIPLTIALLAVALSLIIAAAALIVAGPAAFIYFLILAIVSASPLLFLALGGASLLLCGIGFLLIWLSKQLFWPVKAMFRAGKGGN